MPNIIEITDFTSQELDIYARLKEAQLLHLYEPKPGIFIAESPKVIERALDAGYVPLSFLVERKQIEGEAKKLPPFCPEVFSISSYTLLLCKSMSNQYLQE